MCPSARKPDEVRYFPASAAQEMRWRGSAYDLVNRIYRLRGRVDVSALREALSVVVARHDALRCSLHAEGVLRMRVDPQNRASLEYIDAVGPSISRREQWLAAWISKQVTLRFNRGKSPLLRLTLIRLAESEHVLVIVLDHIISDGISVEILMNELGHAYCAAVTGTGEPLSDAGQYPDWVERQRSRLTDKHLAARTRFWNERFPGGPGDVAVWLPGSRDLAKESAGGTSICKATLDSQVTAGLRQAAREFHVTLNALTGGVLVRELQRQTNQRSITISTSSAARFDAETSSMIGYLATTIWVTTSLDGASGVEADALVYQAALFDAVKMSDVPARLIFERLWGTDAADRMNALPQVGFLCTPFWGESLTLNGIEVEASEYDDDSAQGALSIFLIERQGRIDAQVRFQPDVVDGTYARGLFRSYLAQLAVISEGSKLCQTESEHQ
jgi:hypothetical protein